MKKIKIVNSIDELIDVLGIKKGDEVQIMTPQFDRDYEIEINFIPQDQNELTALIESAPKEVLRKMGVGVWSDGNEPVPYLGKGEIHYLFPFEWYNFIPEGYEVVDINGDVEKFQKGITDDDMRFGCLAYGFIRSF